MREFNHTKFDAEFLKRAWEHGIDFTPYKYKRIKLENPNEIAREFVPVKEGHEGWAFYFILPDREDEDGNFLDIELMAAKRAAYAMRDAFMSWYHGNAEWLEETLDELMEEDAKELDT